MYTSDVLHILLHVYIYRQVGVLINSPNKVFNDIMVLASPSLPVDPEDINSKNIRPISFKFYMWVPSEIPPEVLCS